MLLLQDSDWVLGRTMVWEGVGVEWCKQWSGVQGKPYQKFSQKNERKLLNTGPRTPGSSYILRKV